DGEAQAAAGSGHQDVLAAIVEADHPSPAISADRQGHYRRSDAEDKKQSGERIYGRVERGAHQAPDQRRQGVAGANGEEGDDEIVERDGERDQGGTDDGRLDDR